MNGAFLVAVLAVLGGATAACGGGSSATVGTVTSNDPAHTAAQATEPRSEDPTASQSVPVPPAAVATTVPLSTGAGTGNATTNAPPASGAAPAAGPVESAPPKKISARHVLVQWMGTDRAGKSVLRTREQALVLIQEVQRRAKAGEDLGRLANEYSDEPNAGARGGSLGRFGRGQMVGAFEVAVFKLKVGEVSEIVETPFGFHIIQRTE